jgi:hypothetical protein
MNNKTIQWLKDNIIATIILSSIFLLISYKTFEKIMDKKEVKKEYNVTVGRIIKYKVYGDGPNTTLTYEYIVNEKTYTRLINGPKVFFDGCEDDISLCSNKLFLVSYSKKYPNKSLINLHLEVQENDSIKKPKSLWGFQ